MKRIIIFIIVFLFFITPVFAKQKAVLELSASPDGKISEINIFRAGDRIYFKVYSKKGFKSDYIKYQIVFQNENAYDGGFERYRNITKKVSDKNYFSDYFVIYRPGQYYLQIFDITNLQQWLAIAGFKVVNE